MPEAGHSGDERHANVRRVIRLIADVGATPAVLLVIWLAIPDRSLRQSMLSGVQMVVGLWLTAMSFSFALGVADHRPVPKRILKAVIYFLPGVVLLGRGLLQAITMFPTWVLWVKIGSGVLYFYVFAWAVLMSLHLYKDAREGQNGQ